MAGNVTIIHNIVSVGKYVLMFDDIMYIRISENVYVKVL
jgi:hypothetical protein